MNQPNRTERDIRTSVDLWVEGGRTDFEEAVSAGSRRSPFSSFGNDYVSIAVNRDTDIVVTPEGIETLRRALDIAERLLTEHRGEAAA